MVFIKSVIRETVFDQHISLGKSGKYSTFIIAGVIGKIDLRAFFGL